MKIVILGGGPSGSVAGALLAQRGQDVVIFDEDNRPDTIAGESLVPGVIPILRRLGIEDLVSDIGVLKPGVTFCTRGINEFAFSFTSLSGNYPRYAYNVPRPAFDRILQEAAIASGARKIVAKAEVIADGDLLQLNPATLEMISSWKGKQPDLVIDATGRRRLSAKLFGIRAEVGPRRDVAHFAHFEGFDDAVPSGQVRINHLAHGWAWRIPLRGKMSFGIVMDHEAMSRLGEDPAERLEAAIRGDLQLSRETSQIRRVSEVGTYGNYQLISTRGYGANWVAVGDAFGFVDPMLSPGMMIAMQSASMLDEELASRKPREALQRYSRRMSHELRAWMELIEFFYNGRIFELRDCGRECLKRFPFLPLEFVEGFMSRNMAGMASGFTTGSPFSRGVLRHADRFVLGKSAGISPHAII
jgi:flavin-dependent dehydrogenase